MSSKWGQATFLTHNKEIFYLAYKQKGKSDLTLFEKSSLSPFSRFFPCCNTCLPSARIDKYQRMT